MNKHTDSPENVDSALIVKVNRSGIDLHVCCSPGDPLPSATLTMAQGYRYWATEERERERERERGRDLYLIQLKQHGERDRH